MQTVLDELEMELQNMDFDPEREYELRCEMEKAEQEYQHAKDVYEYYVQRRKDVIESIKVIKEAMKK